VVIDVPINTVVTGISVAVILSSFVVDATAVVTTDSDDTVFIAVVVVVVDSRMVVDASTIVEV